MGTNRRANYLPDTLADKYRDAVNDPELLNMREDLGLIELRMAQLMGKLETDDPKAKWREFKLLLSTAQSEIANGESAKALAAMVLMEGIADANLAEYAVWKEITDLMESRRRVMESESNRLVRMQQMITSEDVFKLVERLLSAIKRYVKDPNTYAAIANEFAIATGAAHNGILGRGDKEVQPDQSGGLDKGKLLGSRTQGADTTG